MPARTVCDADFVRRNIIDLAVTKLAIQIPSQVVKQTVNRHVYSPLVTEDSSLDPCGDGESRFKLEPKQGGVSRDF